jgi:hypothetical protein
LATAFIPSAVFEDGLRWANFISSKAESLPNGWGGAGTALGLGSPWLASTVGLEAETRKTRNLFRGEWRGDGLDMLGVDRAIGCSCAIGGSTRCS